MFIKYLYVRQLAIWFRFRYKWNFYFYQFSADSFNSEYAPEAEAIVKMVWRTTFAKGAKKKRYAELVYFRPRHHSDSALHVSRPQSLVFRVSKQIDERNDCKKAYALKGHKYLQAFINFLCWIMTSHEFKWYCLLSEHWYN